MENKSTIPSLPTECVEQILKLLRDREDRMMARFVCALWRDLIDRDSLSECYCIGEGSTNTKWKRLIAQFLDFRRKKISFRLNVNLKGSEHFWKAKSIDKIVALYFEENCSGRIPLVEINEYCRDLHVLSVECNRAGSTQNLMSVLENCVNVGSENSSVRTLYVKNMHRQDLIKTVQLIDGVFRKLSNVIFEKVDGFLFANSIDPEIIQSLMDRVENLKFVVEFSYLRTEDLFVYDPSCGRLPLKIKSLDVAEYRQPYIGQFLSSYLHSYRNSTNTDLECLRCRFAVFRQSDLAVVDKVIASTCLSLKRLEIHSLRDEDDVVEMTEPFHANKLAFLAFNARARFTINEQFLRSFSNLKSFSCHKLAYGDFIKVLRNTELENLSVVTGPIDVDAAAASLDTTIRNHSLIELQMPHHFLVKTATIFEFGRLKKFTLKPCPFTSPKISELHISKIEDHLKYVKCPELEILTVADSNIVKTPLQYKQFILNILSLFPALVKIMFNQLFVWEDLMSQKIFVEILEKQPKLKKIIHTPGSVHTFNRISPTHIQHQIYISRLKHTTTSILTINNTCNKKNCVIKGEKRCIK